MRSLYSDMKWEVLYHNINGDRFEMYNIFKYKSQEDFIKKLKKKTSTKEEFAELLDREMMWRFWSKCEWEVIINRTPDDRIIITPWVGSRTNPELDVTDVDTFDWKGFAEKHITSQIYKDRAKIDVYDQLKYRWEAFVDYCWNNK